MKRVRLRPRRGVAMLATVSTLVIISLLLAGALASVRATQHSVQSQQMDSALMAVADAGAGSVVADWRSLGLDSLAVGETRRVPGESTPLIRTMISISRRPHGMYWIVSDAAWLSRPEVRRLVNVIVAQPSVVPVPGAPLLVRDTVLIGPAAAFDRTSLASSACAAASFDVAWPQAPVLRVLPDADTTGFRIGTADLSDSSRFWPDSAARVAIDNDGAAILPDGATVTLDRDALWHAVGDVTLAGGTGGGVLLAGGRIHVTGTVEFTGLIVAAGGIDFAGAARSTIVGAVVAGGSVHLESVTLRYSGCAAADAVARVLPPRAVQGRSWAQLLAQ
jgi:hypothetical protein